MSDDNKTNLPPHLQEKLQELAWGRAMDECQKRGLSPSGSVFGLAKEQFMSDAIQIYSLLLQELRPVVGALEKLSKSGDGSHSSRRLSFFESIDDLQIEFEERKALSKKTLKHLKERVLTQERTGG